VTQISDSSFAIESVTRVEMSCVERLLRLIPQYPSSCRFRLSAVHIGCIHSTARFVNASRLARTEATVDSMLAHQIRPFDPLLLQSGGRTRLVVPPVVELHESELYLLDGTHRIWVARQRAISPVVVVVVAGVQVPLPSRPVCWSDMKVRCDHYTTEDNLVQFDRSHFRPLTTSFNSDLCFID
jgi:hypothetical protein